MRPTCASPPTPRRRGRRGDAAVRDMDPGDAGVVGTFGELDQPRSSRERSCGPQVSTDGDEDRPVRGDRSAYGRSVDGERLAGGAEIEQDAVRHRHQITDETHVSPGGTSHLRHVHGGSRLRHGLYGSRRQGSRRRSRRRPGPGQGSGRPRRAWPPRRAGPPGSWQRATGTHASVAPRPQPAGQTSLSGRKRLAARSIPASSDSTARRATPAGAGPARRRGLSWTRRTTRSRARSRARSRPRGGPPWCSSAQLPELRVGLGSGSGSGGSLATGGLVFDGLGLLDFVGDGLGLSGLSDLAGLGGGRRRVRRRALPARCRRLGSVRAGLARLRLRVLRRPRSS